MGNKTRKSAGFDEWRSSRTVVACGLMMLALFCQAAAQSESTSLEIYLPRETMIDNETPTLGEVSIIRGEETLVAKAGAIALGRFSVPGQELIIDRSTVLSRLACSEIPASKVTLIGAQTIRIKQRHQVIKGSQFVKTALLFLKKNPPYDSICEFNPLRVPKEVVVPWARAGKDIKLSPCLVKTGVRGRAKIRVVVLSVGKEIGVRDVSFRLKYRCRRVVTRVDIKRGAVIAPDNVRVEKISSNYPEPANWTVPFGLVAKRQLRPNTVIRPNMVGPVEPQLLLRRNQNVVIRLEGLGLLVTAIGKTMQDGRVGKYIRVRNVDSQRIILARVNEDGSVEPAF